MRRILPPLLPYIVLVGMVAGVFPLLETLLAQAPRDLTPEEIRKRELFLKSREEMRTIEPTPSPKPLARPTPRAVTPRPSTPRPPPEPPRPRVTPPDEPAPRVTPRPAPEPTPRVTPGPEPTPRVTPTPQPPTPATPAIPVGKAKTVPQPEKKGGGFLGLFRKGEERQGDVLITKSGLEQEKGYVPATGGSGRYRYLTKAVRREIDSARVMRNRWKYIIIHNSGTRQGNARVFDYYHRKTRKMVNGLAYHFVIGNGSSSGDGQIEVGNRWCRQINGGHVHSDYLNNIAIGICFVGDFNRDKPSRAQLEALEELTTYLRKRCGKVDGHWSVVRPHKVMNPPRWATDCPGDRFPYSWLSRSFD